MAEVVREGTRFLTPADREAMALFLLNKDTVEVNRIEDDGVNFKMIQWIIPADELDNVMALVDTAGFARQGHRR